MLMVLEPPFKSRLQDLPEEDQKAVYEAVTNPRGRKQRLKKVVSRRLRRQTWSIRIQNHRYRAFAEKVGCMYRWYWLGTHEQANNLL